MTGETKADTWEQREAKRVAEARAWEFERDDRYEAMRAAADKLNHERIIERDKLVREMLNATSMREQTAATILAALLPILNDRPIETPPEAGAALAVKWADALRAELAKVKP